MTKDTTLVQKLDEVLVGYIMPSFMYNGIDKRAKAKQDILSILEELCLEVIGDGTGMYFSKEVPFFIGLEDYMEHIAKVREVQRDEQRSHLSELLGEGE